MDTLFWLQATGAFVFGAIVGSFLNVVILRLPAGESFVDPPSRCPECGTRIAWYDNIPILSWFWLGARCRHCDTPISARYALVEALTAALAVGLWVKIAVPHFQAAITPAQLPLSGLLLRFFLNFSILALLIAITFVDLDHYIVPHGFTLPGIALGLAAPWLIHYLGSEPPSGQFWPPVTPLESAVGALAGATAVFAVYYGYLAVRGVEGIGGGDATLMALVGAWLGWPSLLFVLFASSLQGTLAAAVAGLAGSNWLRTVDEIYGDDAEEEADDDTGDDRDSTKPDPTEQEPTEQEPTKQNPTGEENDGEPDDGLAVPFGPFIALAAVEHFFLGPYLPDVLSMAYLYSRWGW